MKRNGKKLAVRGFPPPLKDDFRDSEPFPNHDNDCHDSNISKSKIYPKHMFQLCRRASIASQESNSKVQVHVSFRTVAAARWHHWKQYVAPPHSPQHGNSSSKTFLIVAKL